MYVCVCVCACAALVPRRGTFTHLNTARPSLDMYCVRRPLCVLLFILLMRQRFDMLPFRSARSGGGATGKTLGGVLSIIATVGRDGYSELS